MKKYPDESLSSISVPFRGGGGSAGGGSEPLKGLAERALIPLLTGHSSANFVPDLEIVLEFEWDSDSFCDCSRASFCDFSRASSRILWRAITMLVL